MRNWYKENKEMIRVENFTQVKGNKG